jgi:hypothetical protein
MLLFTAFYVSALFIFLIKIAGSPSGRKRLDPAGRSPISRKSGQHFHLHDPGAIALIFFANHILRQDILRFFELDSRRKPLQLNGEYSSHDIP